MPFDDQSVRTCQLSGPVPSGINGRIHWVLETKIVAEVIELVRIYTLVIRIAGTILKLIGTLPLHHGGCEPLGPGTRENALDECT